MGSKARVLRKREEKLANRPRALAPGQSLPPSSLQPLPSPHRHLCLDSRGHRLREGRKATQQVSLSVPGPGWFVQFCFSHSFLRS